MLAHAKPRGHLALQVRQGLASRGEAAGAVAARGSRVRRSPPVGRWHSSVFKMGGDGPPVDARRGDALGSWDDKTLGLEEGMTIGRGDAAKLEL